MKLGALLPSATPNQLAASFGVSLLSNWLFNSGVFGMNNGADVSDANLTFLTPTGLTFSVWGIIYTSLAVCLMFLVFHPSEVAKDLFNEPTRQRLMGAFLCNALWLPVFVQLECFLLGQVIIITYLILLLSVYISINRVTTGDVTNYVVYAVGISMNTSWILVANFVNAFVVIRSLGVIDENGVGGTPTAAILVGILLATGAVIVGTGMMDPGWAFVAAWALFGIYSQQTDPKGVFPQGSQDENLARVAAVCCAACCVAALSGGYRCVVNSVRIPRNALPLSQLDE